MAAQPPDPDIEKLLAELRSDDAKRRQAAAEKIAQLKLQNDEIVDALKAIADINSSQAANRSAAKALIALGIIEPPAGSPAKPVRQWSRHEKKRDFLIGFVGWYVVNGGLWLAQTRGQGLGPYGLGTTNFDLILLPINVLVLIVTAFRRKWFALGLLASFAVNLVVALLLGVTLNAYCWVPFFIK